MTLLTVATWNAEGMFTEGAMTRRATPDDACHVIRQLDADVITIPEFGSVDPIDPVLENRLDEMGYTIIYARYRQSRVPKGYGIALLTRLPIVKSGTFRLGDDERDALDVRLQTRGGVVRVIGAHCDDRYEQTRLRQANDILEAVTTMPAPTLVMGDFNAMNKKSHFARLMQTRIMTIVAKQLKNREASIMRRVHEMAIGSTIDMINKANTLYDLDSEQKPTISPKQRGLEWMPSWPFAKIDWIFGTKEFKAESYEVWRDVGSDHRPVRAVVTYDDDSVKT